MNKNRLLRTLVVANVLLAFASVGIYTLAIALLFAAGFFELSFNTMAQALVQINAPADIRGRVVGLFNMAGLGMRAFSGITVGLAGAAIYDAILGQCALKANAEVIYTWNTHDFLRLPQPVSGRVSTPDRL